MTLILSFPDLAAGFGEHLLLKLRRDLQYKTENRSDDDDAVLALQWFVPGFVHEL